MTTQHTHHEHSDVDESVVAHPSAPDNTTSVDSSVTPTETDTSHSAADSTPSVSSTPVEHKGENEQPEVSSTESAPVSESVSDTEQSTQSEQSEQQELEPVASLDVESPSTQEDITIPSSQEEEVATPAVAEETVTPSAEESVTPSTEETVTPSAEDAPSTAEPVVSAEPISEASIPEETQEIVSTEETPAPVAQEVAIPTPVAEDSTEQAEANVEEQPAEPAIKDVFSYTEIPTPTGEVRSFADFIAEFRQAEAALQATLRDSQVEALSILSSVAADIATGEQSVNEEHTSATSSPTNENEVSVLEQLVTPVAEITTVESYEDPKKTNEIPTPKAEVEVEAEKKPAVRPVSPLLRPASRLRLPRHGVARHIREEYIPAEPQSTLPTESPKPVETQQPAAQQETATEPVRPARRYRFDRPAATTQAPVSTPPSVTSTPSLTNTPSVPTTPAAITKAEELREAREQRRLEAAQQAEQAAQAALAAQIAEAQAQKQAATSQPVETPTPVAPVEHGRRRHSQKEQTANLAAQAVPPVVETPVVAETPVQPGEIAPEDLPPLEYSDLQKASSRRRRRHRSGSTNTSVAPSIPTTPTSVTAPTPVVPHSPLAVPPPPTPQRVPAANAPANQSYTIVSGYTVNQMNQGNEMSGPFMGPEPSPARGSLITREGRTTRTETRTSQAPSPTYPPTRSSDNGMSAAAMTQFANIVSQALQTQTDRMVAEFRRMSQAPTNVSVTLPPFPSTERVGVFVDVANLLYSARTLRIGVDFGKLLDFLRGNRRLVRAQAYCPTSPQPGDEQMFLQAVKGLGYRITTKNYKTFSSGAKKADLDLDLCMDVVRLVDGNAVDCIVLVSGDSDFMPMLDYCSDHGVRVEVAAFDEAMSATLRQSCDLFINLSMLEEIRA